VATESLQIRITAELSQLRSAIQSMQGQLENARKTGAQVGTAGAQGIAQLNQRLQSTGRIVAGIAASLGVGLSIAGLVKASDEAATIAARLKLATKNTEQLATAQKAVFDLAQRTRTSLLATVDLYARIERSTRDLKVNQATILQLTETINQAAQISGGGASAEAALFQLSQGLAAGTLRGEELNSVLEQTPRLAQAIADGMNIPIGKLREIAQEGKLTSTAVLRALLGQSEALQKEFAAFPPTIASGFTAIRNAFVQYLQTSDQAGTSARQFAEALQAVARNLPAIIDAVLRLGPAVLAVYGAFKLWPLIAAAVAVAQAAVARFTAQLALMTPAMAAASAQARVLSASMVAMGPSSALGSAGAVGALGKIKAALGVLIAAFVGWQIGTYLSEQFLEVRLFGIAMVTGLMVAWETLKGGIRQIGVTLRETFISAFNFVLDKAASFYRALGRAAENIPGIGGKASSFYNDFADQLASSKMEAEGIADAFNRVYKETEAAKDQARQIGDEMADWEIEQEMAKKKVDAAAGTIGIPNSPATDPKAAQTAAKIAATNAELVRDSVQRALEQLNRLYDDGKMSIRDYYAEKQRLELQGIDASLAAARAELGAAKGADEVAAANAKITMLMRDRKQVAVDAIYAQKKAEEELTRQLGALQIRLLQAQGDTAAATRQQLEAEFKDLLKRLEAEGDTAGVNLAKKVINLETFNAQLEQVRTKVSESLSRFNATETATGAQVDAGILGQDDASKRVNTQREASLALLVQQREELVKIRDAAVAADDALTMQKANDALIELDGNIAQLSINTDSLGYKAAQVLKSSLTTLFNDLADGSKSASEALGDFVLNFIRGMAQIAAQALATYLVLQLLDAIYPGLGKATAATMSVAANHSGGMAGAGATSRQLPALLMAGAPRMHTGGIAGLGADEVPAVLRKGEEVITRNDSRHRYNGGLQQGEQRGNQRFIFVDDERRVEDYLNAPESDEVFVQKIGRNAGAIRELVR
jgi:tape measure domain-containing protein